MQAPVIPARSQYIGGADIAAIIGASKYASPLDVYLRKIGVDGERESSAAMDWGNRLEPLIAATYAEQEGELLIKGEWWRGPESYLGGTPDYLIDGKRRGLEVKTAGARMAHEWGEGDDEVPESYLVQCHWYMALTGFPRWDIAALIGGQDFRIYRLQADPEFGEQLLALARRFWTEHVVPQVAPEPGPTEAAADALARMYRRHRPELLQSTEAIDAKAERLHVAILARKAAEVEETAAANDIKALIGDAAGIEGAWGRITWKQAKDSEYVDRKGLLADPSVPAALIAPHIKTRQGGRRFVTPWSRTNPAEE